MHGIIKRTCIFLSQLRYNFLFFGNVGKNDTKTCQRFIRFVSCNVAVIKSTVRFLDFHSKLTILAFYAMIKYHSFRRSRSWVVLWSCVHTKWVDWICKRGDINNSTDCEGFFEVVSVSQAKEIKIWYKIFVFVTFDSFWMPEIVSK